MQPKILWLATLLICSSPSWLTAAQDEPSVEMTVKRVLLDPYSRTPVVILESAGKKEPLPIWIGSEEATSIALELEKVSAPRPNTHDLIRNILNGVGAAVQRITITDLRNNVYYASIALRLKGQDYQIDSRPSDAIAVALRMKAPIYASVKVLAKAQPLPAEEKSQDMMPTHPAGIRNVRTRRRKLDQSQNNAEQREHASDARCPEHDLSPRAVVESQRRKVQPVRDCGYPSQSTASARGTKSNFGRFLRNVQLRTRIVVDDDLVHRQTMAFRDGPLIGFGENTHVMQLFFRHA